MSNLELMTESFESKLVENIVTVRLRSEALDIVTEPAKSQFYERLESVKSSPEPLG